MSDSTKRMFGEALARLHDAELLSQSIETQSDSSSLLRILGFEVLLKCAIRLSGQMPARHHNYAKLWLALPGHAQKEILRFAKERSPGHTDFSDLERLLNWYQFIFEKARYHYELYEGWTLAEQSELGKLWEEIGAPTHEAVVQYHPEELFCLTEALKTYMRLSIRTMEPKR